MRGVLASIPRPALPAVRIPTLGPVVDVPVYLIHSSTDPEDYFFVFDFEQFVERSRSGLFVKPRLLVTAGRDDFDRRIFARHVREAFTREFDAAREALTETQRPRQGWLSWAWERNAPVEALVPLVVLGVATSVLSAAGRAVLGLVPRPRWMRGRSPEERLEAEIADTQKRVDDALSRLHVRLHMDLYRHAWRGERGGRLTGMDYDAWPLPASVRRHLGPEGE